MFECTILILLVIASYAWANIKHIATRICYKNGLEKFKQVYIKLKVDMAMV